MSALPRPEPARQRREGLRIVSASDHAQRQPHTIEVRPAFVVLAATLIGGLVRLSYTLSASFPLNDGGMFYAMMSDLQHSGFRLPETTTYNFADIPFAYPPLGLYAGAALSSFSPIDQFDVFRFVPLVVSVAAIPAFYLLARSLLPSRTAQLGAMLTFALLPRTFMWMIMGGGVTRSFGFLFAILALWQLHRAYTTGRKGPIIGAGLFAGLTLLSHTEMLWLFAVSAVVFFVALGRSKRGALISIAGAAIAALVAAPWWMTVVANHGLDPFLNASGSRPLLSTMQYVELVELNMTNERLLPILSLFGLAGAVLCVATRRFFLPVWLAVASVTLSWILPTAAAIPLALLAGVALDEIALPLAERLSLRARSAYSASRLRWASAAVLTGVALYVALSALVLSDGTMSPVSAEEQTAMSWVGDNLPESSEVIVMTNERWWRDKGSEWFPVLAGRPSVVTVQGIEWLPDGAFEERLSAYRQVQDCADETSGCLQRWRADTGVDFTHVYVSKAVPSHLERAGLADCCASLRTSLLNDPAYEAVYDGEGATIFAHQR